MLAQLRPALIMLIIMTILTGAFYPLLVTGIAQIAMSRQANGSVLEINGKTVGSELIGQAFSDPKYFWSRASGTAPFPYNAGASGGANHGPTNPALAEAVGGRIKALRDADPGNVAAVPVDLVTASASGLDPHISPAAAEYQVARVAKARRLDAQKVRALVAYATEFRQLGFLGEPRVNVLKLNLALDAAR
jgi:K+-transporting ATPase ATPase C chain